MVGKVYKQNGIFVEKGRPGAKKEKYSSERSVNFFRAVKTCVGDFCNIQTKYYKSAG